MRTKGHELKLENSPAPKSASNSFAIALCGINSPGKETTNNIYSKKAGKWLQTVQWAI
jgi:hypothetical protein